METVMEESFATQEPPTSPEGKKTISYRELGEIMFKHFEERDNLKAELLAAVSSNADIEKQNKLAIDMQTIDSNMANRIAHLGNKGLVIVDLFMGMIIAMESYNLLASLGLKKAPQHIYTGAQYVEASIRAEIEDLVGRKFDNTKLELIINAAEGKAKMQQENMQNQQRIILASR